MTKWFVLVLLVLTLGAGYTLKYNRTEWKHWIDVDKDCQSTRVEVLISQADGEITMDGCSVVSGVWDDPYSGETFTDPKRLDVDHIVPLQHAWEVGGWRWDNKKRSEYANWEPGLLVVSASLNRQKGAKPPDEWLPPAMDKCEYMREWVRVKNHWDLLFSIAEFDLWYACQSYGDITNGDITNLAVPGSITVSTGVVWDYRQSFCIDYRDGAWYWDECSDFNVCDCEEDGWRIVEGGLGETVSN